MRFPPFLLDQWLSAHEGAEFDLASSTGPKLTLNDVLNMAGADRERFTGSAITYSQAEGARSLRLALAEMYDADPDEIQVVTGASEALLVLFALAAEPGANVIIPFPGFPSFAAVPAGFGIEVRQYRLRRENGFAIDPDAIKRLADAQTRLVLVNSPHNPTGACVSADVLADLHDFCVERGIWFVSDEVYHPLYYGAVGASAASLPRVIVLGSCSKAFCASGTRVGWILDRDAMRRDRFWTSRAYFTISNTPLGEAIAETVIRQRDLVVARAREVAAANLAALDSFFSEQREFFGWVHPSGGTTSFPWLTSGADSRPFCEAAVRSGVMLAPGDCFGMPDHFRLGFAAVDRPIGPALDRLAECQRRPSVTKTVAAQT